MICKSRDDFVKAYNYVYPIVNKAKYMGAGLTVKMASVADTALNHHSLTRP